MTAGFREINQKIIIHTRGRLCETREELLQSELFARVLIRFIDELKSRQSRLLNIFNGEPSKENIDILLLSLKNLLNLEWSVVAKVVPGAEGLFVDRHLFRDFIEDLYNYWRGFERYVICDSEGDTLDRRPYRTFNQTVEKLTALVMSSYRDIQENITGTHPRIYRQLPAGAGIASICIPREIPYPPGMSDKLAGIRIIRQILLNPPVILEPSSNKRTGTFLKVDENPVDNIEFDPAQWLCYPAMAGDLLINVYFHESFYDLGFSLCNLFELADDNAISKKPDAVFFFGVPGDTLYRFGEVPAVFYDDEKNGIMVGACPGGDMFGYFGYLKKMTLTLHNCVMMKRHSMPFHGALVKVMLKGGYESTILLMGDSGAGKSETLEAFRNLGRDYLRDMIIVADDMGSLKLNDRGEIIAYGTETGAFLRIDDLKPGYAFGQIDRAILMSATRVNARIIIPVATYDTVIKGHRVDMVLYANNYEEVDAEHPVIEKFNSVKRAINVFREGTVMSKGTTTSTGIVHSYFANIFGPLQYRTLYDSLASEFFNAFYENGIFVGQIRTRLGIPGYELKGPDAAARGLLHVITGVDKKIL